MRAIRKPKNTKIYAYITTGDDKKYTYNYKVYGDKGEASARPEELLELMYVSDEGSGYCFGTDYRHSVDFFINLVKGLIRKRPGFVSSPIQIGCSDFIFQRNKNSIAYRRHNCCTPTCLRNTVSITTLRKILKDVEQARALIPKFNGKK